MGNARCDVHGIDKAQPLADTAFRKAIPDLRSDIQEPAAGGNLEPEFFAVRFHMEWKWRNGWCAG